MLPKDCVLLVVLVIFNFAFYSSAASQFSFTSNILPQPSEDLSSLSPFCTVVYPEVGFCLGPFPSNIPLCAFSVYWPHTICDKVSRNICTSSSQTPFLNSTDPDSDSPVYMSAVHRGDPCPSISQCHCSLSLFISCAWLCLSLLPVVQWVWNLGLAAQGLLQGHSGQCCLLCAKGFGFCSCWEPFTLKADCSKWEICALPLSRAAQGQFTNNPCPERDWADSSW